MLWILTPLFILFLIQFKRDRFHFVLLGNWDRNANETSVFGRKEFRIVPAIFSYLGLASLIFAAALPGQKRTFLPEESDGIDIMIALDISGSMVNSFDFLPKNRLSVSKNLLKDFVEKRENDRIGLVLFAGAAYLQSPLTSDKTALQELIGEAEENKIEEQGTAIGDALVLSTYRLKNSKAKSRIILLLTDGVSNTGRMDPETASFTTKAFGIKVYSIGIGKETGVYETNYDALTTISNETNGKFFRAETPEDLSQVLAEINSLEVTPLPAKPTLFIESKFQDYLVWAFIFFALEFGLKIFPFRELV